MRQRYAPLTIVLFIALLCQPVAVLIAALTARVARRPPPSGAHLMRGRLGQLDWVKHHWTDA